jgi:hypothetical protein
MQFKLSIFLKQQEVVAEKHHASAIVRRLKNRARRLRNRTRIAKKNPSNAKRVSITDPV